MAPSRADNFSTANSSFGLGSDNPPDFTRSSSLKSNHVFDDHDRDGLLFDDVFGGPPKYSSTSSVDSRAGNISSSFDHDSIFKDQSAISNNSKANSMPSFDKPVYDDDIFEGLPGLKSSSASAAGTWRQSSANVDDVFASISSSPPKQQRSAKESSPFDDLLGNLGKKETESRVKKEKDASVFDDLLPGFGRSSSPISNRSTTESIWSQKPPSTSKTASSGMKDPFVGLGSNSEGSSEVFTDPLEEMDIFSRSGSARVNDSSISGGTFDDLDPLNVLGKSVPPVSTVVNKRRKDRSPLRPGGVSDTKTHPGEESIERSSENSESYSQNRTPVDNFQGSHDPLFDMPSASTDSHRSVGQATSPASYNSTSPNEIKSQVNSTPRSEDIFESSDDILLTVSEIPLFTQPTSVPPSSRPPSPRLTRLSKLESFANERKKVNEFSTVSSSHQYSRSPRSSHTAARGSVASQIDELEDFAMGRSWNNANEYGEVPLAVDVESSVAAASAAAMKEAMDRAEAKFRHAEEVRERESLRAARSKEFVQLDKDESGTPDAQERLDWERQQRERQQREKEEEEREQRRVESEREREREREEREREQRRLERERERAREIEREREKARQAVERATREARERAAAEARLKAERAAVDKANAAARECAERAAVQRAQAEARERAAAEARERAEKAAAEARERAAAEARERANAVAREREARERASVVRAEAEVRLRAERAAVGRAAAEARERAAAEARERAEKAAAEARERAAAEARERANAVAREREARERASVARAEAEARLRAERAAVGRAAAEARERAAAEARERAAAAARASQNQQKN